MSWLLFSGWESLRARASRPPVTAAPKGTGGAAGSVLVVAPGQAARMVSSTMSGGTGPGTQTWMRTPAASATYSKARCGDPKIQRFHAGASRPVWCAHHAGALAGSTWGGTDTVISRASREKRSARQRLTRARKAVHVTAAALSATVAAGAASTANVGMRSVWSKISVHDSAGSAMVTAGRSPRCRGRAARRDRW